MLLVGRQVTVVQLKCLRYSKARTLLDPTDDTREVLSQSHAPAQPCAGVCARRSKLSTLQRAGRRGGP